MTTLTANDGVVTGGADTHQVLRGAAALDRDDSRLTLRVSLDSAVTWKQVPVNDEAAASGTLEQLG